MRARTEGGTAGMLGSPEQLYRRSARMARCTGGTRANPARIDRRPAGMYPRPAVIYGRSAGMHRRRGPIVARPGGNDGDTGRSSVANDRM
jgi:hypothetical protein